MATIADLIVKISGDSSNLRKELAASQRQIRRTFGSDALDVSSGAITGLTAATVAMGALGLASIKMAGDFQASSKAFETLLGSADQAKAFLEDLQQFGAETPFELKGLMDTSKKLLAFKFAAEDIIPIMNTVGDAAAMLGSGQEGIDGMTMAISQMQAKGRVQGEELLQLAERGVNAYQYLATAMGTDIPGIMDMVSKGMVDSQTGINAILTGMQNDFRGGMEAQSKEIPGIWSNIKDSTENIFKEWGKSLIDTFNIKGIMNDASNALQEFANIAKSSGINAAIRETIPAEVTASIFMFAGALAGVGVAAMYMFGASVWTAMAPLLPFIAAGIAIGALAYLIYDNWEPLSSFFGALWESVGAHFENWTLKIQQMLQEFTIFCFEKLRSILKLMGTDFSSQFESRIANMRASLASLTKDVEKSDARTNAATQSMREAWDKSSNGMGESVAGAAKKINKEFNGLKSSGETIASSTKDGADKAAKELEKLEEKAKQVSEAINRDWVSATKNQQEQLEIWYAEQISKLDEVAAANANYEQDKLKITETYTAKREKLMQQEADKAIAEFDRMKSSLGTLSQDIVLGGLRGSEKDKQASEFDYSNKTDSMKKTFDDINRSFENADAESKKRILANLDQFGIDYKNIDGKRLDFSKTIADAESAYLAQKNLTDLENHRQCKDIKADIDQAYAMNSLAMLQESLSAEDAERLNNYEAQKSMMDTYQEAFLAAHATSAQLMADLYKAGFSGLSSSLSDILTGAKSVSEAFSALGKTLIKVVADFVAKWIAGRVMMGVMGKQTLDAQTKASIASASAQLPYWSSLASAVSLATFGANAAPAAAGMTMVYGLGAALTTIPALANGGITTGNTIANIGEGHYQEAVMPLSKKYFEKVGLVNDGQQVTQNIYGDINSGADYEDMWDDLNDMFAGALRGV